MPKTDEVNQSDNVVILLDQPDPGVLTPDYQEMVEVIRRRGGVINENELLTIIDNPSGLTTLERLRIVTRIPAANYHHSGRGMIQVQGAGHA